MKKTLALILAAMMVAGTSAVAFAVDPSDVRMGDEMYVWNSDNGYYESISTSDDVEYGNKIAFELTGLAGTEIITDSDEVKNLKAYPEYKVGESLVAEKPSIVYKKVLVSTPVYTLKDGAVAGYSNVGGTPVELDPAQMPKKFASGDNNEVDGYGALFKYVSTKGEIQAGEMEAILAKFYDLKTVTSKEYRYVIELELKESTSTASKDFFGEMYVGRTANGAKDNDSLNFNLTVRNEKDNTGDTDYFKVEGKENYVIDFDDSDVCDIEFMSENGNTSYALFTVDASGQGKENVGFSVKFNSEIAAKYPEANLEFLSFTAKPVFNRTGELYIYADEDSFIYEVTADGLKEIKNAEYDESSEAWVLKTRYLKSYVTSDVELDLTADKDEASSSETSSSNPVTGGTTGTTEGNTNVKPNPNTGR